MRTMVMLLVLVAGCPPPANEPRTSEPRTSDPSAPDAEPGPPGETAEPTAKKCTEHKGAFDKASPQHTADGLHAAATCHREAGQVALEIQALRALAEDFPDDPRAKDALRGAGQAYERIGHAADAARMYEHYARRYGAEPDAVDLLKQATCLRQGFGDDRAAQSNLEELRRRHRVNATLSELCPKAKP